MRESLRWSGAHIKDIIPDDDIINDREFLERHLGFVMGDDCCEPDIAAMQVWSDLKKKHAEGLKSLETFSDDDEIEWEKGKEGRKERKQIGHGGFSNVYAAHWRDKQMAVKESRNDGGKFRCMAQIHGEAFISASIGDHRNVVGISAMSTSGLLIMELTNNDLRAWYQSSGLINWSTKMSVLYQAASGLHHLHECGMTHRDVKSNNFIAFHHLSDECLLIKLYDLGITIREKAEWIAEMTKRPQPRTQCYVAPEIHMGIPHSHKSDVFSFGLVIYEITTQMSIRTLYATLPSSIDLCEEASWQPSYIPSGCPKDLIALIVICLSFDPKQRPSMERFKESLHMLLL